MAGAPTFSLAACWLISSRISAGAKLLLLGAAAGEELGRALTIIGLIVSRCIPTGDSATAARAGFSTIGSTSGLRCAKARFSGCLFLGSLIFSHCLLC